MKDTLIYNLDSLTNQHVNLSNYYQLDSLQSANHDFVNLLFCDSLQFKKILHQDTISYTTSVFQNHQLQVSDFNYTMIPNDHNYWILGVLFVVLICYIFSILYNRKWVFRLGQVLCSKQSLSLMKREMESNKKFIFIPLLINAWCCFSLFVFYIFRCFYPLIYERIAAISLFGIIILFVLIWFIIYISIRFYIRYLYELDSDNNNLRYYFISIMLASQFIFPCLCVYYIYPTKFMIGIMICIYTVLFLFRNVKCFLLNLHQKAGFKYFLYLCIVEILPWFMLYKFLEFIK